MRTLLLWTTVFLACPILSGGEPPLPSQASSQEGKPRVFVLTQSAGYEHGVVKRKDAGSLSIVEQALTTHGRARYDIHTSQDARELIADLASWDAVVFYTTGELPLWPEEREQLLDWVADGGAFVGVHCATDTMYATPDYLAMVGGAFDGHPWHAPVTLKVEDDGHPSTAHLGATWTLTDEIYQFRDWRRFPDSVLLSLDPESADTSLGKRADGDYANAWWKAYGRGRVFYTALGHRPELWRDEVFLRHVFGGVDWALRGPDGPVPAPTGAVLLDHPDAWHGGDGQALAWEHTDGLLTVAGSGGNAVSREQFGDALIHVEFRLPHRPGDHTGPHWANSGVYVQGRYELQVLDTAGNGPALNGCGAIYNQKLPARDATRETGAWQTYDIRFRAARFDATSAVTSRATMSVWHNGLLVHDDVELAGVTPGGLSDSEVPTGPLMLQDHGDPVAYRNVWVLPTGG